MTRAIKLSDAGPWLGALKKKLVVERLKFSAPPRERRKSQSEQASEIRAMAKNVGRAEGEQGRLPLGGRTLKPAAVERNENELHFNVVGYIRRVASDAIILHTPNMKGIPLGPMFFAILELRKKLGVEKGAFDLPIFWRGRALAIEIKSPKGGRLSDEQERWQKKFERNGGKTLVSNDWHEIVGFLKQHGIGRG